MTKTIILTALAAISVVLSFFYEVVPAKSALPEATAPAFHITPYAINSGEDLVRALELNVPVEEAEETGQLYKKLNLRFAKADEKQLAETVAGWIGTPYRYGRSSKKGADCSGFVSSIYREVYGINLRHSSHAMFQEVERVQKDSIRTGDL
ncbi:MAG: NlpC/P60 family protein, partial [Hymenobacteraceae bacterium]|nr:NlpC/P60 family protein [Hymenobacteraceae bacterium]MDX5510598.1 NlpC/P60 family protein [Hymenobacteraceae bacterium]